MEQGAKAKSKDELRHELLALSVATVDDGAIAQRQVRSEVVLPVQRPLDAEHLGLIWQLVDAQQQKIRDNKKAREDTKTAEDKKAAEARKALAEQKAAEIKAQYSQDWVKADVAPVVSIEAQQEKVREKDREMQKVEALLKQLENSRRSFSNEDPEVFVDMPPVEAIELFVAESPAGDEHRRQEQLLRGANVQAGVACERCTMRAGTAGGSAAQAQPCADSTFSTLERIRRSKTAPENSLSTPPPPFASPSPAMWPREPGAASQSSRDVLLLAPQRGASSAALERARRGNLAPACAPQSSGELMDAVFARSQARQEIVAHAKRLELANRAVIEARTTDVLALASLDVDGYQASPRRPSAARATDTGLGSRGNSFACDTSPRMGAC